MINLTSLLLLTLLSFTLQIEHCKEALFMCLNQVEQQQQENKPATTIPNCLDHDENGCKMCKKGFALSDDYKTCVSTSIDNCLRLDKENICQNCYEGYYFDGVKCESLPEYCAYGSEDGCNSCADYAEAIYDKNNRITACEPKKLINGCDSYNDEKTACERCVFGYSKSTDGSGGCTFNGCGNTNKVEFCDTCELGYYTSEATGKCVKNGETDADSQDSSFMNKVGYFFLLSTFILLI